MERSLKRSGILALAVALGSVVVSAGPISGSGTLAQGHVIVGKVIVFDECP